MGGIRTVTTLLFLDNAHIVASDSVIRRFHQPTKHPMNPVLVADLPWERSVGHNHGTVLYEDGRFRFWYQVFAHVEETVGTFHCAYAESTDGITWHKPSLGNLVANGSRDNNFVAYDIAGVNVVRDQHEDDPDRRYKLLYYGPGKDKPGVHRGWMGVDAAWGWCMAFSPDGMRWETHPDNPVLTGAGDDGSFLGYDSRFDAYVAYPRPASGAEDADSTQIPHPRCRKIGISTSPDCEHWSEVETVIAPDEDDPAATQFYSMPVFTFHDWILGLLYMHYCDPVAPDSHNHRGLMDVALAASRDGRHWLRLGGRQPLIPRGDRNSFDKGMVGPNNGVIEKDGELWFYYNGWSGEHYETKAYRRMKDPGLFEMGRLASGIGLARLRKDGFVSLEAGEDEGEVRTTPLTLGEGRDLRLNMRTVGSAGYVLCDLLDESGKVPEGFQAERGDRLQGDSLTLTPTWAGQSAAALPSARYSVRLRLRSAEIFSVMAADAK